MRRNMITMHVLVGFVCFALGIANAAEPKRPNVDQVFSPEKEERISQLAEFSVQTVFENLKGPDFTAEEEYLNKAVQRAFNGRNAEAVQLALGYVKSGQIQKMPDGPQQLYVAKKVLEVFADEALESLLDLYGSGGPKVRRNVIYVVGQMAGGEPVRALLIHALEDTSSCEDVLEETIGDPMRICDVAYNQLVIRYRVQGVLRAIGTSHSIMVRDHHIGILKNSSM
jgi:hypothetical protein